jgi:hypothetical protein
VLSTLYSVRSGATRAPEKGIHCPQPSGCGILLIGRVRGGAGGPSRAGGGSPSARGLREPSGWRSCRVGRGTRETRSPATRDAHAQIRRGRVIPEE